MDAKTEKLDVYVEEEKVACLELANGLYRFTYLPGVRPENAISLTMGVKDDLSDWFMVIPPALQVNFPEGVLLETIYRLAGKAMKIDDDFDVLALVGRNMVGRVRMVPEGAPLHLPTSDGQPVIPDAGSLLRNPNSANAFSQMITHFATRTGLSGMMPKGFAEKITEPKTGTFSFACGDSIVKMETEEYLGVATVEYACLEICRMAGIPTVEAALSDTGETILVKRFDLREDGSCRGFEDFCALTGVPRTAKYSKDLADVARGLELYCEFQGNRQAGLLQFFQTTVMNTALRNGDAHLKNFGLLYEDPTQDPVLAPAYDIVCTTAWLPHDQPALPMNGLREWPNADALRDFGKTCCYLDDETITRVFDDTLAALRSSDGLLNDLQTKYPDVLELQHLREVVERSAEMLSADIRSSADAGAKALSASASTFALSDEVRYAGRPEEEASVVASNGCTMPE
jgi:serine/threonine-protein kinase HipA